MEEVIGRVDSDRRRDLPGSLDPADSLASPPIRHAGVDEARLDVSMTEVILYEVDRLACVEKVRRHGMPHRVYVSPVGREIRECGIAGGKSACTQRFESRPCLPTKRAALSSVRVRR